MNLRRIYIIYLQLIRAKEIIFVILRHAMREWINRSRFGQRLFRRKKSPKRQVYSTPERIRITIEELGPTYIKFGQILADRPDMVSERFRNELKKLQSKAKPFSNDDAHNLIRKELGLEIEEVFSEFDTECFASASIGQVYKARLITGEDVIVKIQRPHIENKIKLDLYLMRYIAKSAVKNYPELAAIDIVGLIDEFGQSILRELDYYNESSNLVRFGEMFKDDPRVHIPKVFMDYTTRRILIMEQVVGVTPDSPEILRQNGLDPEMIATNGADIVLKMVLKHGFFHADPHPGNIFILPENVIALIDFGMVGVLKPNHLNFLANFAMGFYRSDAAAITQSLITLCGIRYFNDESDLEFEIDQLLKSYAYLPFEKIDFARIMQECINLMVKYQLKIPSSIFMLVKALATIQKFAGNLHPGLNLGPVILPYARELVARRYDPRKLASGIYETIDNYVTLFREFPGEISEILYKIKQGKLKHEIRLGDPEPAMKALRNFGQRMALAIILAGLGVTSTILIVWNDEKTFGHITFGITMFFTIWVMFKWLFRSKE
ncbi:MAG: ubiquinone biosynthesis protein [Bacteroidetes bacterium]|nr:MAG: ubiquinone biosynthesis protein [Bacteroidota bacterium]